MYPSIERCSSCVLDSATHGQLNVGITGHRPHRLPTATGALLTKIQAIWIWLISARYRSTQVTDLHIYSGLAEGIDRLAIRRDCVTVDYTLHAVLPCDPLAYSEDFAPGRSLADPERGTIDEFQQLLAGCEEYSRRVNVQQAERNSSTENHYAAAGQAIIDACDVLFAVYDGGKREAGGTGDVLASAINKKKAVIELNPFTLVAHYHCARGQDKFVLR